MTQTYNITGMTCGGCQAKVKGLLSKVEGVKSVGIELATGEATLDIDKHIRVSDLKAALSDYPKYQLSEVSQPLSRTAPINAEEEKASWLITYKPILLIFAYIIGVTLLVEWMQGEFNWMRWMNHFMAGFFLVFSFFKLLNLRGFADSYSMYDIVAKEWKGWGYVYAFLEMALGIAFLTGFNPVLTNSITLVVMSVSIIGVAQSVFKKQKIKCACLGDVFNLPMSTVTIIEDGLMMGMSALMLITML